MGSSSGNLKVQNLFWKHLWNKALDIVFPPICPGCGAVGAAPCSYCSSKIQPFPSECGYCRNLTRDFQTHQHCKNHFPISRLIIATKYDLVTSKVIEDLKYRYVTTLAQFVAGQIWAVLKPVLAQQHLQPVLVPVPLHPRREAERGFNQSKLICQALVKTIENNTASRSICLNTFPSNIAVAPQKISPIMLELLERTRYTTPQASLSRQKRLQNLTTAFAVKKNSRTNPVKLPPPKSLFIIVDDVVTTGATLTACARILKHEFPFHPIWGLAYARRVHQT